MGESIQKQMFFFFEDLYWFELTTWHLYHIWVSFQETCWDIQTAILSGVTNVDTICALDPDWWAEG